jgi:hypothetical protein
LLLCVAVAVAGLWCWQRELVWLLVAAPMTGLLTTMAHPLHTQSERLLSPIWLTVVFGAPVMVTAFLASRPSRHPPADRPLVVNPPVSPGRVENNFR